MKRLQLLSFLLSVLALYIIVSVTEAVYSMAPMSNALAPSGPIGEKDCKW
jgi:hypothetical protein